MNVVEVFNETKEEIKELSNIEKILDKAIKLTNKENIEFSVIIVDNKQIHQINKEYRNIDKVTDVITFALEDEEDSVFIEEVNAIGDIYISLDKAKEQALEYNHSLNRELCFLAVHGYLHLLGYDHMTKEDEIVMFSKQKEILDEVI